MQHTHDTAEREMQYTGNKENKGNTYSFVQRCERELLFFFIIIPVDSSIDCERLENYSSCDLLVFYCVVLSLGHAFNSTFFHIIDIQQFFFFLLLLWCVLRKLNALCISAPNHSSNLVRAFCIDTDIWFRNKCQKCRNMNCCFIVIMLVVAMRQMNLMYIETRTTRNKPKERIGFGFEVFVGTNHCKK